MYFKRRKNINRKIAILLLLPLLTGMIFWGCDSVTSSEQEEIDEELDTTKLKGELVDSGIHLSWTSITGAETYDLYRSQDTTEQDSSDIYASGISNTTYTDNDIQSDSTNYYYQIRPVAGDQAGPTSNKLKMTNFTVDPIATDRLVGTHYYLWWGNEEDWTQQYKYNPVLGNYSSSDLQVINQHIKWALEHGIQWFSIGWSGPKHDATATLEDSFLEAKLADKINFSILYETVGIFGEGPIDINATENRERFQDDLEYMNENYFQRDNYMHIDDQPVLFLFLSHGFKKNVKETFEDIFQEIDVDPYIIAGLPSWNTPDIHSISETAEAITSYDPYTVGGLEVKHDEIDFYKSAMHRLHFWANKNQNNQNFIPVVIPGKHGTETTILDTSPDIFENILDFTRPHITDAPATLITAFNEWSRNTMIEPSKEFGGQYLDMVKNQIATGSTPSYELPAGTKTTLDWEKSIVPSEIDPNSNDDRSLSFQIRKVTFKNKSGDILKTYNIGTINKEPILLRGIYSPESNENNTWRWFGGPNALSEFIAPDVNNIASIEIRGRASVDMSVTINVGNKHQTKTVYADGVRNYVFNFN
jgi:hypothetical protein